MPPARNHRYSREARRGSCTRFYPARDPAGGASMLVDTKKVLAVILGGGAGTRLFPLTKERAKPAVPLAGKYR